MVYNRTGQDQDTFMVNQDFPFRTKEEIKKQKSSGADIAWGFRRRTRE